MFIGANGDPEDNKKPDDPDGRSGETKALVDAFGDFRRQERSGRAQRADTAAASASPAVEALAVLAASCAAKRWIRAAYFGEAFSSA